MSGENARHVSTGHAKPPEDVQHIGKYRLIKTIGRGNFAKVKLARHVPTGRQVISLASYDPVSFRLLLACMGDKCTFVKFISTRYTHACTVLVTICHVVTPFFLHLLQTYASSWTRQDIILDIFYAIPPSFPEIFYVSSSFQFIRLLQSDSVLDSINVIVTFSAFDAMTCGTQSA